MNAIRPARLASGCVAEPREVILAEGLRLLPRDGDLDGVPFNGRFEDAEHDREAKTIVFKFKRKKQYRRTIGHRQNYTRVQINEIV